jgi:hypothetical protein
VVDAQPVEVDRLVLRALGVGLVRDVDRRLVGLAEQRQLGVVDRSRRLGRVEHADDHVGFFERDVDLALDALTHGVVARGIEAARVDEQVGLVLDDCVGVVAVARDTWLVVYDRHPATHQAVEQCALAHVGAADDGDDRLHPGSSESKWTSAPCVSSPP